MFQLAAESLVFVGEVPNAVIGDVESLEQRKVGAALPGRNERVWRAVSECPQLLDLIFKVGLGVEPGLEEWEIIEQGNWRARAACRDEDPEQLFVRGAEQHAARMVCVGCRVRTECLAEALDRKIEFDVWGGMTERERRALLRRRPEVRNWRTLLETARQQYADSDIVSGSRR